MEFWQLLHCCKMVCSQLIHKWRATSNIRYMLTQARAYYFTIKMSCKSSCRLTLLFLCRKSKIKQFWFTDWKPKHSKEMNERDALYFNSQQSPCISLWGDFELLNFLSVAHVIFFCFFVYIKTTISNNEYDNVLNSFFVGQALTPQREY